MVKLKTPTSNKLKEVTQCNLHHLSESKVMVSLCFIYHNYGLEKGI